MPKFPHTVAFAAILTLTALFAAPAAAQSFGCFIPQDRLDSLLSDLGNITNLTREIGCRKDEPCIVKKVLEQVAKEKGLPAEMVFAVTWTESNWQQWDNRGRPVGSYTNDYGLMQINEAAWGHKYDFTQIRGDLLYNARAGADILKWSYDYARRKGYRGRDLWRATYAVYNGGPRAVNRPWNYRSRYRHHDTNFARYMNRKPWVSKTRNCGNVARRPDPQPSQPTQPDTRSTGRYGYLFTNPPTRRRMSPVMSMLARYFGLWA